MFVCLSVWLCLAYQFHCFFRQLDQAKKEQQQPPKHPTNQSSFLCCFCCRCWLMLQVGRRLVVGRSAGVCRQAKQPICCCSQKFTLQGAKESQVKMYIVMHVLLNVFFFVSIRIVLFIICWSTQSYLGVFVLVVAVIRLYTTPSPSTCPSSSSWSDFHLLRFHNLWWRSSNKTVIVVAVIVIVVFVTVSQEWLLLALFALTRRRSHSAFLHPSTRTLRAIERGCLPAISGAGAKETCGSHCMILWDTTWTPSAFIEIVRLYVCVFCIFMSFFCCFVCFFSFCIFLNYNLCIFVLAVCF